MALADYNFFKQKKFVLRFDEGEKILYLADKFLKEHKVVPSDITGLVIYQGEGTFTSLRLLAVFVNAWAYALKIPIYNLSKKQFKDLKKTLKNIKRIKSVKAINPAYKSAPTITKPKKKLC